MKKTIFLLGMVLILILGNAASVFADAVAYDMDPAGYYVYVATPDGGLNIRTGPGTNYNKVMEGRIPDNVQLYIEYTSGNWGYTSYNGHYGWVALAQTTTTPPTSQPVEAPVEMPKESDSDATQQAESAEIMPIEEPQADENAQSAIETVEFDEENKFIQNPFFGQIILIAALVISVVIIAVLLIIIINMKSRK